MRQVPAFSSYLLLGDGRMARHAAHYLELLQIPYSTWKRSDGPTALHERASLASHVLVLVSDRSIESLLTVHTELQDKVCVHFSGSLVTPLAVGAHPLMTFSNHKLYSFDEYKRIPFMIEKGRGSFAELLPGLPNASYELDPARKPLYHALCVMAGNFTVILWEKVFAAFTSRLGLPKAVLIPYLERITRNLAESRRDESVLTGPLARGDQMTIEKNLTSLEGDPFADVYRSFVNAHGNAVDKGGHA